MNKFLLFISILFSCNQSENRNVNINNSTRPDSVSLDFDSSTFRITDTFIHQPDGEEALFRKLTITNHLNNNVYIEKIDNNYKFIRPNIKKCYNRKSKGWGTNFSDNWGINSNGFYEIKPKSSDTFIVSDPFINYDSILLELEYFSDTISKKADSFEGFYNITKDNKIINYYR